MAKLTWQPDTSRRLGSMVAYIGNFEATITEGGARTIGANVFVGTFAGRVEAISAMFEEAENAIQKAALRELLNAGHAIGGQQT